MKSFERLKIFKRDNWDKGQCIFFFSEKERVYISEYIYNIYNNYSIIIHNNYSLISRACKKRLSNCPNCHKRSSPAKRRLSFTLIIKLLMKELARRHDESTVEGRIFTPSHAVFSKFNELYQ